MANLTCFGHLLVCSHEKFVSILLSFAVDVTGFGAGLTSPRGANDASILLPLPNDEAEAALMLKVGNGGWHFV